MKSVGEVTCGRRHNASRKDGKTYQLDVGGILLKGSGWSHCSTAEEYVGDEKLQSGNRSLSTAYLIFLKMLVR